MTPQTCLFIKVLKKFLPFRYVFSLARGVTGAPRRGLLQFDSYGVDVRDNGAHEDGQRYIYKCSPGACGCRAAIGRSTVSLTIRGRPRRSYWSCGSLATKDRLRDPTRIPTSSRYCVASMAPLIVRKMLRNFQGAGTRQAQSAMSRCTTSVRPTNR